MFDPKSALSFLDTVSPRGGGGVVSVTSGGLKLLSVMYKHTKFTDTGATVSAHPSPCTKLISRRQPLSTSEQIIYENQKISDPCKLYYMI